MVAPSVEQVFGLTVPNEDREGKHPFVRLLTNEHPFWLTANRRSEWGHDEEQKMAAIVIDSPRWREGWGEPRTAPAARPALRIVGAGTREPDRTLVRRRRLAVVVLLGLVLAIGLALASVAVSRPASAGAPAVGRQTHVVTAGETYWSIAADRHHGHGDLRVEVAQLIDANGGRALFAGDRIELP
jgi:hypothetical protein